MYILMPLLLLPLTDKLVDAFTSAANYAAHSKENDAWFASIEKNTEKDDNILMVFGSGGSGYSLQAVLRVWYILNIRHDRSNIYYMPFPREPELHTLQERVKQEDTRYHSQKMRSVFEVGDLNDIDAVILLNWGASEGLDRPIAHILTDEFVRAPWFRINDYRRENAEHGHVCFYKK